MDVYDSWSNEVFQQFHATVRKLDYFAKRADHVATDTLTVDANWFGKEPPAWLEKYIEVFFYDKGRVECDLRRRVIFSVLGTFTVLPLRYGEFDEAFGEVDKRSFWFYKRSSTGRLVKRRPLVIWSGVLVVITLVASGIVTLSSSLGFDQAFLWVGAIELAVAAVVLGIMLIGYCFNAVFGSKQAKGYLADRRKHRAEMATKRDLDERQRLARDLEAMSCTVTGTPMTIERIKARQRTNPVVITRDLKDKVCLPYQRK
jgi:hypothetical protein